MPWRAWDARRGVVAVLLAAALAAGSGRASSVVVASADGNQAGGHGRGFSVSGSVSGLFPGAHTDLVVTVINAMPFAIRVTQLSTTVGDASATCTAANLAVGGFTGTRDVSAKGSATVALAVTMSRAAGDACQGAHFPLQYSAAATRVGG